MSANDEENILMCNTKTASDVKDTICITVCYSSLEKLASEAKIQKCFSNQPLLL